MYYPVIIWDYISYAIMATLHATKKKLPRFFEVFFWGLRKRVNSTYTSRAWSSFQKKSFPEIHYGCVVDLVWISSIKTNHVVTRTEDSDVPSNFTKKQ